MQRFLTNLGVPIARKDGERLGKLLEPDVERNTALGSLIKEVGNCDRRSLEVYKGSIASPWDEVTIALIQVGTNIMDGNYSDAYREQAHLVNQFFRFFINQTVWVLPVLDQVLKHLRSLADKADAEAQQREEKTDALDDAARICNKAFTNCLTDRSPLTINGQRNSRKWGTYRAVAVTLKSYIKAGKMGLHKSLLRSLTVQTDMPPFDQFPKADQVACKYYFGLLSFLSEDWSKAYEELTFAWNNCHRSAIQNQELILTYLIPLQLMRGRLPSSILLSQFPRLRELYGPFLEAIRAGNAQKFDVALAGAEPRLLQQNTWIAVEKVREVCMRGLLKHVWMASGKKTRLPISNIMVALKLTGGFAEVDPGTVDQEALGDNKEEEREKNMLDEAECITAAMIFHGFVRGYISHEKRMIVLAAKDPFPSLSKRNM